VGLGVLVVGVEAAEGEVGRVDQAQLAVNDNNIVTRGGGAQC
jgi:hypothetical protein